MDKSKKLAAAARRVQSATLERDRLICELRDDGLTWFDLAKLSSLTPSGVRKVYDRRGSK